ncbi:MAG: hypothetical protein KJ626_01730 [Verrucomicrobia bacterium]|nr:hypothetical protein [Verrucomicrobiota bacterium]
MTEKLRVAILHYHLRPGGVTRVIQQAVTALKARGIDSVVLTGEEVEAAGLPCRLVEELNYHAGANSFSPADITSRVRAVARGTLGGDPDLWHIHNHCLGKNLVLPLVAKQLADDGESVLLQIHDFAEDGRPGNYRFLLDHLAEGDSEKLGALLYPAASNVHYAVLNGRDGAFLIEAGLPPGRVHLLPNAVWLGEDGQDENGTRLEPGLFVYPTRAIRRKNLGELIFWSAVGRGERRFAVTLSPENPLERPFYDRWTIFAGEHGLPVEFDVGTKWRKSFREVLQSAEGVVTTSVAEGFGLAFLEPWLVGRPLYGRNLPEITEDFTSVGVDLSSMYTRLPVPERWVDLRKFRARMKKELGASLFAYGREVDEDLEARAWRAAVSDEGVEFSKLDEDLQMQAIRCGASEGYPDELMQHPGDERLKANGDTVRGQFGIEAYGGKLTRLYHSVVESPAAACAGVSVDRLLDSFLAPERFALLRT